jgi:hypothetical protein
MVLDYRIEPCTQPGVLRRTLKTIPSSSVETAGQDQQRRADSSNGGKADGRGLKVKRKHTGSPQLNKFI